MGDNCTAEKYNFTYIKPYYYKDKNPNNCCNGQFEKKTSKNVFGNLLVINKNSRDKTKFGDISYPRSQNGRWNTSLSNTKMHPINSIKAVIDLKGNPILDSTGKPTYKTASHSGNIFRYTHHNTSKKKMFAYFSKNKSHIRR